MNEAYEGPAPLPRVAVSFRKSSSRDGGEGYDVDVRGDSSDEAEAARVMELALKLRKQALEALKPPSIAELLQESIESREKNI